MTSSAAAAAASSSHYSSSATTTPGTRTRRRIRPRKNEAPCAADPGPGPPGPGCATTKTAEMALSFKSTTGRKRRLGATATAEGETTTTTTTTATFRVSSAKVLSILVPLFMVLLPLPLLLLPTAYESSSPSSFGPYGGVDAFRISDSQQRRQRRYHLQLQLRPRPMMLPLQQSKPLQHKKSSTISSSTSSSSSNPFLFGRSRTTTTVVTTTTLFMGKGDGKKKRPKKKKTNSGGTGGGGVGGGGADSTASSSSTSPQRVTNDLNIPIRRQIMYGKLNKAMRSGTSGTSFRQAKKVRTSYRRSWNETEIETAAEARRRKGQDVDWDVVLNSTLWKNPPLVLVDGYNVINKWSRLKKHFAKGDLERSRRLLCDDLENLAELKGWRIEVVFDAARSSPSGQASNILLGTNPKAVRSTLQQRLSPSKEVLKHGRVRTVFTGSGIEADSYIEGRCLEAKSILKNDDGKLIQSLIVATDDNMIRVCASSAGAVLMSASRFVTELKACQHSTQYRVELAMSQVNNMPLRPEKLWNSNVFVQSNYRNDNYVNGNGNGNGKTSKDDLVDDEILGKVHKVETKNDGSTVYVPRFGSGSVIIEDRRNRNRNNKKNKMNQNKNLQDLQNNQQHQKTNNNTSRAPSTGGDSTTATSSPTTKSKKTTDESSSSSSSSPMFDILGEYKDPQQQQQQQRKKDDDNTGS